MEYNYMNGKEYKTTNYCRNFECNHGVRAIILLQRVNDIQRINNQMDKLPLHVRSFDSAKY